MDPLVFEHSGDSGATFQKHFRLIYKENLQKQVHAEARVQTDDAGAA